MSAKCCECREALSFERKGCINPRCGAFVGHAGEAVVLITAENAALRAENARLKKALARVRPYAAHRDDDEVRCAEHDDGPDTCTCGLTAALQETRHE